MSQSIMSLLKVTLLIDSMVPRVQSWPAASVLLKPGLKCTLVMRKVNNRNVRSIHIDGTCWALVFT